MEPPDLQMCKPTALVLPTIAHTSIQVSMQQGTSCAGSEMLRFPHSPSLALYGESRKQSGQERELFTDMCTDTTSQSNYNVGPGSQARCCEGRTRHVDAELPQC